MKVREFIELLNKEYDPEDELYFATGAAESEHVFDEVMVEPKDSFSDETGVYLSFNKEHKKDFESAITLDVREEIKEELQVIIAKYLNV